MAGSFSSREQEPRQDICQDPVQATVFVLWYNRRFPNHRSEGTGPHRQARALLRVHRYPVCGFHSVSLLPCSFTSISHSTGFFTSIVI